MSDRRRPFFVLVVRCFGRDFSSFVCPTKVSKRRIGVVHLMMQADMDVGRFRFDRGHGVCHATELQQPATS